MQSKFTCPFCHKQTVDTIPWHINDRDNFTCSHCGLNFTPTTTVFVDPESKTKIMHSKDKMCPKCPDIGYECVMQENKDTMLYFCPNCHYEEPIGFVGLESAEPADLPDDLKYCHHFNLHRSQGDWVCTDCGVRHPDSGWVVYFSTVAEAQAKGLEILQNDLKKARKDQKRMEIIRAHVEKFPLMSATIILKIADHDATAELGE